MDIIDFWEALKRQKVFLIVGLLALVIGALSINYQVEDLSFDPRVQPKYTGTVQLAVVPAGVTSMSDPAITANYEAPATFYAQLLQSPQAHAEIAQAQNVEFSEPISVSVRSRTGIMTVTVTATTPGGAERAALGTFRWLEEELARQPLVAALPEEITEQRQIEVEGGVISGVSLAIDQSYALDESGLWIAVSSPVDDGFRLPLADAPFSDRSYSMILDDTQTITLRIEDQAGSLLAIADMPLPPIDTSEGVGLPIVLTVPRGGIVQTETDLAIRTDSVVADWDFTSVIAGRQNETTQLSIMRLTDDPVIGQTGLRRVPVMLGGALIGGTLVLLALATTRDRIQQLKLARRRETLTDEDLDRLRADEPVS